MDMFQDAIEVTNRQGMELEELADTISSLKYDAINEKLKTLESKTEMQESFATKVEAKFTGCASAADPKREEWFHRQWQTLDCPRESGSRPGARRSPTLFSRQTQEGWQMSARRRRKHTVV